jgi:hypothetical protein
MKKFDIASAVALFLVLDGETTVAYNGGFVVKRSDFTRYNSTTVEFRDNGFTLYKTVRVRHDKDVCSAFVKTSKAIERHAKSFI